MRTPEQVAELIRCLKEEYPGAQCSLDYEKPWELLFATRLAAQCTDARVNLITPILYKKYPTLEALAGADLAELEEIVRPCGFYHTKARDIIACANALIERHGGEVPDTMEALTALPGVGRKTANLVLGDVFKKPAVVVDTHCIRLCNLIGLVDDVKEPAKVEKALWEIIPPEEGNQLCHRFVDHGRAVCVARRPQCDQCCLAGICRHHLSQRTS